MSAFGGLILTNNGRNLQAKAQLGTNLHFTRIALGDNDLGGTSILDLNSLKHEVKSLPIVKLKLLSGGKAVVGAVFSNQDMASGFYWREIGVFADDPENGEILYCYGNAGTNAEYIPAGGGADIIEKAIDVTAIVGNAQNVTAAIDQSLIFASQKDIESKVDKVSGKQLSTEDYTTQEKQKLASLSNYSHPSEHPATMIKMGDGSSVEEKVMTHLADIVYQVAGGTAIAITITGVVLENGHPKTFIASADNGGSATTINTKPLYKPGTTNAPTLKKDKAYTVWYNSTGDCFFIKASAEGNTVAGHVLAGDTFSNDNDTGLVGTMPNRGVFNLGLGVNVPAGYYSGGTVPDGKKFAIGSGTASNLGYISARGLAFQPATIIIFAYKHGTSDSIADECYYTFTYTTAITSWNTRNQPGMSRIIADQYGNVHSYYASSLSSNFNIYPDGFDLSYSDDVFLNSSCRFIAYSS